MAADKDDETILIAHRRDPINQPQHMLYHHFLLLLGVHLLLLENTANIRTLAILEAKNVRTAAPAQL